MGVGWWMGGGSAGWEGLGVAGRAVFEQNVFKIIVKICCFCKSRPSRVHETTPRCIPTAFLQYFVNPSWRADDVDGVDGELKGSGLRPSWQSV